MTMTAIAQAGNPGSLILEGYLLVKAQIDVDCKCLSVPGSIACFKLQARKASIEMKKREGRRKKTKLEQMSKNRRCDLQEAFLNGGSAGQA